METCECANHLFEVLRMGCPMVELIGLLDSYKDKDQDQDRVINFPIRTYDETCFSLALTRLTSKKSAKRWAVAELLLQRGADPNYVFLSGISLLQLLVWWDDLSLVKWLLDCPLLNIETTKALIYSKSKTIVMLHMFAVYRAYERTEDFGLQHVLAEIGDLPAPAQVVKLLSAEDRLALGHAARQALAAPSLLLRVFKHKQSTAERLPDEVARLVAQYLLRPAPELAGFARILNFLF